MAMAKEWGSERSHFHARAVPLGSLGTCKQEESMRAESNSRAMESAFHYESLSVHESEKSATMQPGHVSTGKGVGWTGQGREASATILF